MGKAILMFTSIVAIGLILVVAYISVGLQGMPSIQGLH